MATSTQPAPPRSGGRMSGSQQGRFAAQRPGQLRSHRRRSRWRVLVPMVALLAVATVGLSGAAADPPPPPYPGGSLPIATGDRGTVYYSYGLALLNGAEVALPDLDPYLTVTPSVRRNLELLAEGKAQIAFASAETIAHLPNAQISKLATLARIYDDYLHLVVRRDGPIHTLTDLRNKRVSIGGKDSGAHRTARLLLHRAGLDPDTDVKLREYGVERSADALREGTIDAFFFFGGVPTNAVEALTVGDIEPIRLVDLEDWIPRLRGYGAFYTRLTIPASSYGVDPVTTVGVPNYLVVPRSMDPDLAYALTAMLFEQRELMAETHPVVNLLDRRAAINTLPLRLHPGAQQYFRDTQI